MILALDTSGGELVACLLDDDLHMLRGLAEPGRKHQDRVVEVVQELLGAGRGEALDSVAVARGPGSQTGLRVGLATAEGLAFARRLPIVPVSSLAVAAHRLAIEGTGIAAVSAGRSNVYAQAFQAAGAGRRMLSVRVRCALDEVHARLGLAEETPLATEPALSRAGAGVEAIRSGAEALAAATREAVGRGRQVAYDRLAGDYGE
ncbi:MAG: tRNA (adenosine(37)-N6)-threonylcarbamoyltransferase complex dimerization subunit type 1 TsaB [Candidatus Dormibacteria bacterium]